MHPDLRLSNLDSLPVMKRRLAKSIMAGPITKQTLAEFAISAQTSRGTATSAFTPLFYFLLDPSRMPPISALDALDANTLSNLSGGFLALTCIVDARPSRQTFPDLWPRISSWSYYVFQHEEFLVKVLGLSSLKEYYLRMMKFLDHMSKLPSNQATIVSARTSHVLAARAWSYYSDQTVLSTHPGALLAISEIFIQGVVRLDDIFEGLDGDVSDLACLIARQSELAVPPSASQMDMDKFCYLVMTLSVVSQIDDISNSEPSHRHIVCSALLPQGFVRTLTIAGLTLSDISPAEFSKEYSIAIGLLLCVLQVLLEQDQGSQSVQTAVRCGLLRTLLVVSTWTHYDEAVVHYIHLILTGILGPFTVYYPVLEELEKVDALDIVHKAARLRLHPKLVEGWRTFGSAVRARLELRDSFHSDPAQCRNVCGSCGTILAKNLLRRCSRCRWEMYCSTDCQARDWRSGHRLYCALDHISRIKVRMTYTRKEYTFLRFLLHHEYTTAKFDIALAHVLRWKEKPDTWVFTAFDFRYFPVRVNTKDIAAEAFPPGGWGYVDQGTRTRMVAVLPTSKVAGAPANHWAFLLARENESVVGELREIAGRMRGGGEGDGEVGDMDKEKVREEVKKVMEREGATAVALEH
ncbi:hypothetical protein R3P38DRAFT_3468561 [Favolaschia claudopus]|uniref:MYND-type domain-containing protein n=1 Tax=Favolaschia claudopus TaxID=2862362 RepID=A0AAW0CN92_9AGAR